MITQRISERAKKTLYSLLYLLALGSALGCAGGVRHPDPGEENDEQYCAKRPLHENNCMACSALPGCGWCDSPKNGKAHCQPGTAHDRPASCAEGWALSSEDCAEPPPPPPPPPPSAPPVDVSPAVTDGGPASGARDADLPPDPPSK